MKISELTHAAVTSPEMLIPVELYGQTMNVDMGQIEGKDSITVLVTSDRGNTILNGEGERTLTASVLLGGDDITHTLVPQDFSWRRISSSPESDAVWNQLHEGVGRVITVTAQDVVRSAQFICDVIV